MDNALTRRHHHDRPLAKLTDDELRALEELGEMARYLRTPLDNRITVLSDLSFQEAADREMDRQLQRAKTRLEFDGVTYTVGVSKTEGMTHISLVTTHPPLGLGMKLYEFNGRLPKDQT